MPALQVLQGPNAGRLIPLHGERFILGRNPDCDLTIPISLVSRRHAVIVRSGSQSFIEDTQSRNGAFVNNQRITGRTALRSNDRIRLCDFIAAFLEESAHTEFINDPDEASDQDLTYALILEPPTLDLTEGEWLTSHDPLMMLERMGNRISERKLRLFACACCRKVWHLLASPRAPAAVELTEHYADGLVTDAVLLEIAVGQWAPISPVAGVAERKVLRAVQAAAGLSRSVTRTGLVGTVRRLQAVDDDQLAQADLLRDIAGNPFRPATVDPDWLAWDGGVVSRLAQSIYDDRSFEELPVLADALEEAGCTRRDILDHCRSGGNHARGCWLLDLVRAVD